MGKLKRMDQIMAILKTYLKTRSIKATARRLKISKNTVRTYLRRVRQVESDLSMIVKLGEEEVLRICKPPDNFDRDNEQIFEQQVDYWIDELRRVGVTRQLLWNEYRVQYPSGYGYSQFCDRLRRAIGRLDLTVSLDHTAGQVMQVDFAGEKMHWVDYQSGELCPCEVLVCVMPPSLRNQRRPRPSCSVPS